MHMAPRAAAWVAWAVWTCNTRFAGASLRSGYCLEESGLRPALFLGRLRWGRTHSEVRLGWNLLPTVPLNPRQRHGDRFSAGHGGSASHLEFD
jgi:hypothetical protein